MKTKLYIIIININKFLFTFACSYPLWIGHLFINPLEALSHFWSNPLEIGQEFLFYNSFILPLNIKAILNKIGDIKQNMFNNFCIYCLNSLWLKPAIVTWHRFLFWFRISCIDLGLLIEKRISLNFLAFIISMACSRLQVAGYLIFFCLLFIRLDFAVLSMARFYKRYPKRLEALYDNNNISRSMWTRVSAIAQEAASNPQVQTISVAVAGALAWKALDVYDLIKTESIAEAENKRHEEEMAMRKLELEEAKASRNDENRRHSEEMIMRQKELDKN
jgi:hypothetical protein